MEELSILAIITRVAVGENMHREGYMSYTTVFLSWETEKVGISTYSL